jgi:hypothetical protein
MTVLELSVVGCRLSVVGRVAIFRFERRPSLTFFRFFQTLEFAGVFVPMYIHFLTFETLDSRLPQTTNARANKIKTDSFQVPNFW